MVTLVKAAFSGPVVTGGGVGTLAFEDPVDDDAAVFLAATVTTFWASIAEDLDEDVEVQVLANIAQYTESTGTLERVWATPAGAPAVGGVSGSSVARASQALIRWRTDEIVGGRVLQGRTFIPGVPATALTDAGGLSALYQEAFKESADALIDDTGGVLEIWHRPQNGGGGSVGLVTAASVWDQLAVLRSRRD